MQYVKGEPLSVAWRKYSEGQKEKMVSKLAELVTWMGSMRGDGIGGLDKEHRLAETMGGSRLPNGGWALHHQVCYPIGPFQTTREYVLACYDREIYYYEVMGYERRRSGKAVPKQRIEELTSEKKAVAADKNSYAVDEPFVLCHGDLNGRNIMVRGTEIVAVLGWDFAGFFPLSEIFVGGGNLVEAKNEAWKKENAKWVAKIQELVTL